MAFSRLPHRLQLYIVLSLLLGTAALGGALVDCRHAPLRDLGLAIALSAIVSSLRVELDIKHGRLSLSSVATFLAIMLWPGGRDAIIVSAVGGLVSTIQKGRRLTWYKPALTTSNVVLSAWASAFAWNLVWHSGAPGHVSALFLGAVVLMTTAYFAFNTIGISLALALVESLPVAHVWKRNFRWTWPGELCAACFASAASLIYSRIGLAALLLLPPIYVVYSCYRLYVEKIRADATHLQQLNALNTRVIGTLAMTIEAKDRYTHKHVERVREYAVAIAEELHVTPAELEAIRIGALVHDIGKIAIPEAILTKPGKLTPDEFERMKSHVLIGVKLLEMVEFPFPVAQVVAAHHERWDGNGYPSGLKGEEIPLVGRIVALADGFDALTSDRPYRNRLSQEDALALVQAQSGTQYDPKVVNALTTALPRLRETIAELDRQEFEQDQLSGQRRLVAAEALQEIAQAAEESAGLSEMALNSRLTSTEQEVAALLIEKVQRLLPTTSVAVFLRADESDEIHVAACAGLFTGLLENLVVKVGEGISGWVVGEGLPALNSPASGDLSRRVKPGQNLELNSSLSVPLLIGRRPVGAVTVYHTGYNLYTTHHQRILTTLADHAAGALDTIFRLRANQVLANTDSLTGLPNMRFIVEHIETLLAEEGTVFSLILLDLNDFKPINDQYGHLCGDRILQDTAAILQEATRSGDVVGRYAGDEFLVVCQNCGQHSAMRVVERIRSGFESYKPPSGVIEELSASIGLSTFPADGDDWRSLLSAADIRMYGDKLLYHQLKDTRTSSTVSPRR